MTIEPKNKHFGLDKSESKTLWGRKLYRVVALASLALLNGDVVEPNARGGWCSDESIVTDKITWLPQGGTFWGGTFRGGTFEGGTFEGGTFWGGTFEGGTFWGGTFRGGTFEGGTFRGGTFEGGTFRGGTVEKQPLFLAGLRWEITITDQHMTIGCQHHELVRWWSFDDRLISRMDTDALAFWQVHKATLQALCVATERVAVEQEEGK